MHVIGLSDLALEIHEVQAFSNAAQQCMDLCIKLCTNVLRPRTDLGITSPCHPTFPTLIQSSLLRNIPEPLRRTMCVGKSTLNVVFLPRDSVK